MMASIDDIISMFQQAGLREIDKDVLFKVVNSISPGNWTGEEIELLFSDVQTMDTETFLKNLYVAKYDALEGRVNKLTTEFLSHQAVLKPLTDDFAMEKLRSVKLLAADLDKTLYPNGMGNATTDPTPAAREEFDKNVAGFMKFMKNGHLAIPVTGNSPALAQRKFDRSLVKWNVEEHPGVFCNGALVLGIKGVVEYSAPVPTNLMKKLQAWVASGDGLFEFEGIRYPFAVNCMTKSKVLYFPPKKIDPESRKIADGWASMQLMTNEICDRVWDWEAFPAYQVNILLKNKVDLLEELGGDATNKINNIQAGLLAKLEDDIGKLEDAGCQSKSVVQPWCEINIVVSGSNKGQSLNRFIHCKSVKDTIGIVNVGTEVMVVGDAANDLPMFVEWSRVDDFLGDELAKTERPAIRVIMPDAEDDKLLRESNLSNKVHEVLDAILQSKSTE